MLTSAQDGVDSPYVVFIGQLILQQAVAPAECTLLPFPFSSRGACRGHLDYGQEKLPAQCELGNVLNRAHRHRIHSEETFLCVPTMVISAGRKNGFQPACYLSTHYDIPSCSY